MRPRLPVSLALFLLLGIVAARADQFSPAQRAEIVRIVRDALKQDPSILRDAVAALQAEEGSKEQATQRAAIGAARQALVADPADPVAGNTAGDVTIVEFFDTRCPYCRKLEPAMASLIARDRGVRLVYKDLPVLGPTSVLGSKMLLAAQRQSGAVPDAYAKLRSLVMNQGPDQSREALLADARRVGLDVARLEKDMDNPATQRRIDANLHLARDLGIEGTPALVIGDALIPGAVDLAELEQAVAAARSASR
ncbi:MAG: DsbA family protein [Alphaproteobacteria bacterium]|nr:DsbA family protein [Alphaproteobacteria bacterium]